MISTHDWFTPNIPALEKTLKDFKGEQVFMLEIGCYEGMSTVWFLGNILTHPHSKILCVDTFDGADEHKELGLDFSKVESYFKTNTEPFSNKVTLWKMRSDHALLDLKHSRFDIVFIDGSHNACDVLSDAILSWRLLNPGGVMLFDDYGWDRYVEEHRNPRMAIDAFMECNRGKFDLLESGYQVHIRKL